MKKMIALTCALAAVAVMADFPVISGSDTLASGFTAVTLPAASTNVMIGVTYQACGGSGNTIAVRDLVSTNNLKAVANSGVSDEGACLRVLTSGASGPVYQTYYLDRENGWTPKTGDAGTVAAGAAVFLANPEATTAYIKGGLVVTKPTTTCQEGYNLVSSVSADDYTLGDFVFTAPNGATKAKNADRIILQNGTTYWYKSSASAWVNSGTVVDLSSVSIPAGTGFWYVIPEGGNSVTVTRN